MRVSVVVTVYNESTSIRTLLDSLCAQTRRPDQVVICDGGSTDDTVAQIQAYAGRLPGLRVLVEPGANISQGRNRAIQIADGPIIAVTDAGVRLDPRWLERLVAPFESSPAPGETPLAVAGFFLPDADGVFQTAMAATVLPLHGDIRPEGFLPSSRSVAFLKRTWEQVGGYPEWLDYCEDLVFDLQVNRLAPGRATAFQWAPDAVVYFRPRATLGAFWRQYYRYARGDGKADLWRWRHAIRYLTYLVLLPALVGHGLWARKGRALGWVGLAAGGVAYCARPWQRLSVVGRALSPGERWQAALWVPVLRAVGDLAKMVGYPVGLWWRWRNRARAEIHWRRPREEVHAPVD